MNELPPGQRLRKVREEQGVRRSELASELGIHYNTLTRWEHDQGQIPFYYYKRIMAYFDIDVIEVKEFRESQEQFKDE